MEYSYKQQLIFMFGILYITQIRKEISLFWDREEGMVLKNGWRYSVYGRTAQLIIYFWQIVGYLIFDEASDSEKEADEE